MPSNKKTSWVVRYSPDVASCRPAGKAVIVEVSGWRELALEPRGAGVAEALLLLAAPGASLERLTKGLGQAERAELTYLLNRLERIRVLEWAVYEGGQEIAALQTLSPAFHLDYASALSDEPLSLSRFAYLRRLPASGSGDPGQAVLESGASRARMTLAPDAAARLAALAVVPGAACGDALLDLARRAGFVAPSEAAEPEGRRTWEFHDRLFHEVSRGLWETEPTGGTYRMKGVSASPPAVVALPEGPRIALPDAKPQASSPLEQVLAERRSIRHYAERPIDLQQISDLLYRVARTTGSMDMDPQDLIKRPYPSGGSIHELQFYLAVWNCEGLERGLYRYIGETHELLACGAAEAQTEKLLARSGQAMGLPGDKPQVLLIVTTRHPRMAWKYQSMAYRASLMNVGVVFQTLYLVATDLGLAACANGAGDSRVFEEASGLDSWDETAVGEFALGRAA